MRAVALVLLTSCGAASSASAPPANVASSTRAEVTETDFGALALIPVASITTEHERFVPVSAHAALDASNRTTSGARTVLDAKGGTATLTAAAGTRTPFGCDENAIDTVPLDGPQAKLAPGVGWILPPATSWHPRAFAVVAGAGSETQRVYTAGPVRIALDRTKPASGTVAFAANARSSGSIPFERTLMEGAPQELAVVDLRQEGPGVPVPVGVWALDEAGPYLVTLYTPTWEGVQLDTYAIDTGSPDTDGRKIEALSMYLYQCAF